MNEDRTWNKKSPKIMKRHKRRNEDSIPAVAAGTTDQSPTKDLGENGPMNILQLPETILLEIFSYLSVRDKCRSTRVCKKFHRVMKDSQLWKRVDVTSYRIKLQDLTKLMRRYFSKSLRHLELRGFLWTGVKTNVLSENFLTELQGLCPNILELVITNAELRHLHSSKLPRSLQVLRINTCQLKEGWLGPAMEEGILENLKCLDLSGCGRVTNRDVISLATLKNLEELNLMGCYRLSDKALERIGCDHPNLKSLLLGHSDFTDNSIQDISQNLENLTKFAIQNCEFLTSHSLKFVKRMKKLEELDISYNPHFDNDLVYDLVKGLPYLRKITVQDVNSVRDTIMEINANIEEVL